MASWHNDYEYLAEILAHRQRHGTEAEYRLRYVWDRVVEWTPVSRLRKATQQEIDYVLDFCKAHHSPTIKLDNNKPHSQQSGNDNDADDGDDPDYRTSDMVEVVSTRKRSRSTRATPSTTAYAADDKKNCNSIPYDGIVEQDGMVYEKSVFEFHEACRRRRELKRKAIGGEMGTSLNACDGGGFASSASQASVGQSDLQATNVDTVPLAFPTNVVSQKVRNSSVFNIQPSTSAITSDGKSDEIVSKMHVFHSFL
ncbi:unnamed protein product [Trichobilharzia regenti]|nr:unnamed protein product [Trichobilharzia regenti]